MAFYPIDKQMPTEKYKKLVKITYIMVAIGGALLFIIPLGFNKLIPPIVNHPMHYESSGK